MVTFTLHADHGTYIDNWVTVVKEWVELLLFTTSLHYIALFPFSDFAICKNVVKMEKRPA